MIFDIGRYTVSERDRYFMLLLGSRVGVGEELSSSSSYIKNETHAV